MRATFLWKCSPVTGSICCPPPCWARTTRPEGLEGGFFDGAADNTEGGHKPTGRGLGKPLLDTRVEGELVNMLVAISF